MSLSTIQNCSVFGRLWILCCQIFRTFWYYCLHWWGISYLTVLIAIVNWWRVQYVYLTAYISCMSECKLKKYMRYLTAHLSYKLMRYIYLLNDKEFCFSLIGLNSIFSTLPQSEYTSRAVSTSRLRYIRSCLFFFIVYSVFQRCPTRRDFISSRPIKLQK
jgi:hypothetical protein